VLIEVCPIHIQSLNGCGMEAKSTVKVLCVGLRRTCSGQPELLMNKAFQPTAANYFYKKSAFCLTTIFVAEMPNCEKLLNSLLVLRF